MVIIRPQAKTAAELKLFYGHWSAQGILTILAKDYGMWAKTFMWGGEIFTVKGALVNIPSYLLDVRGGDFGVIRFYGGPIAKAKYYNGTILTMLCDAVLFEMYSHGMVAEQRLMS